MTDEQELLDYDETDDAPQQTGTKGGAANGSATGQKGALTGTQSGPIRGSYVSIHASGFKDFLLKPELLRAIMDCGFEHPSEGQCCLRRSPQSRLSLSPLQCNTNPFLRQFSAQTSSAKRSQAWAKPPCSFSPRCNSSNQSTDK